MLLAQVALVSDVPELSFSEISRVAAALQKQATRDFTQAWGMKCTVDGFASLEEVPVGYWPIIVVNDVQGAEGFHTDENGQPYALVKYSSSWSLTASHECLEMLADSFGNRLVAGQSPKPDQGRVEFLVEVCDPAESAKFAYTVNGVLVSDFYTPRFFDPIAATGVQYSYTGALTKPLQVLPGGYLSWHEPVTNHWWQLTYFGQTPEFVDLGVIDQQGGKSIREIIDQLTPHPELDHGLAPSDRHLLAARQKGEETGKAASARAKALREQIKKLPRKK
ncbi:MAG: hypothetical protein E6J34_23010 [Chloroflexi bacterium]|nr:MAG: hypothetical protein E6J34_23010 [Chloroflexota bacterium]